MFVATDININIYGPSTYNVFLNIRIIIRKEKIIKVL
jgi:hypothetical protein